MKTPAERLRFTLHRFGYHRAQGKLAKQLGINAPRFSRILNGAPMYQDEIIAVVNYFPGVSYRWLLEGIYYGEQVDLVMDRFSEHLQDLSAAERLELVELLRGQDD